MCNPVRLKNVVILNDGQNYILYKPNTKKVVIGLRVHSRFKSKYRSFKAKSVESAKKIGFDFINEKLNKC